MSLLNVGARALLANQVALQTTGHNIANVSVAGYSRQTAVMQTVQGQFTGGGYIGNGVEVTTILRNHNELLTRQAAAAQAVQAADVVRAERVTQMQDVFQGGPSGLGASITDMLNSLVDVVSSPTDITARTVTLTRMDEMASRMRSAAEQLQEIQYSVNEQLHNNITRVNDLAKSIADVNEQIARVQGNGQTPNDLLDQRDQLVREINQYVQTTQIPATDGTLGIFVGGSQALVAGWQLLTVNNELFDTNNNFASNRFTPTVPGRYLLTTTVRFSAGVDVVTAVGIYKNGTLVGYNAGRSGATYNEGVTYTTVVEANGTGDYFEAHVWGAAGANALSDGVGASSFSGSLIGGGGGSGAGGASGCCSPFNESITG